MTRTRAQTDTEINTYNKRFFDTYIDLLPIVVSWYKDEVWKLYTNEGIKNWQQFCTSKLSVDIPKLNRDDRKKVVTKLNESGLSTRAIAYVLNIGKSVVDRDLKETGVPNGTPQRSDQPKHPNSSDLGQIHPIKEDSTNDRKLPKIPEQNREDTKPVDENPDELELLGMQTKIIKHMAHVDSLLFDIRRLINSLPIKSPDFSNVLIEYAGKIEKEWRMTQLIINISDIDMDDEINKLLDQGL